MALVERIRLARDRRRLLRVGLFSLVGVVALACILDHFGAFAAWGGYRGDDIAGFDGKTFLAQRVLGGDAIEVVSPTGKATPVALLGINIGSDPDNGAADYLAEAAVGKMVTLRLEPLHTRDRAGRLLAYVFVAGYENLNLQMVRRGYARCDDSYRHALAAQFGEAQAVARKKKVGVWK